MKSVGKNPNIFLHLEYFHFFSEGLFKCALPKKSRNNMVQSNCLLGESFFAEVGKCIRFYIANNWLS